MENWFSTQFETRIMQETPIAVKMDKIFRHKSQTKAINVISLLTVNQYRNSFKNAHWRKEK